MHCQQNIKKVKNCLHKEIRRNWFRSRNHTPRTVQNNLYEKDL